MNRIECPYEELLKEAGYIQIYDGQSAPQRPNDPTSLKPEERKLKFFVRYYQKVENNHPVNKYVKLVYDLSTGNLRHFPEHYRKTSGNMRQVKNMLAIIDVRT